MPSLLPPSVKQSFTGFPGPKANTCGCVCEGICGAAWEAEFDKEISSGPFEGKAAMPGIWCLWQSSDTEKEIETKDE